MEPKRGPAPHRESLSLGPSEADCLAPVLPPPRWLEIGGRLVLLSPSRVHAHDPLSLPKPRLRVRPREAGGPAAPTGPSSLRPALWGLCSLSASPACSWILGASPRLWVWGWCGNTGRELGPGHGLHLPVGLESGPGCGLYSRTRSSFEGDAPAPSSSFSLPLLPLPPPPPPQLRGQSTCTLRSPSSGTTGCKGAAGG